MILIIKLLFSKSDDEGALGRGLWVLLRKWSLSFRYVIFIMSYQNSVLPTLENRPRGLRSMPLNIVVNVNFFHASRMTMLC